MNRAIAGCGVCWGRSLFWWVVGAIAVLVGCERRSLLVGCERRSLW
ncbi:MAG: hypothetical protein F6K29_34550, partial [Okeania sp. SIO2G5]|nr:hypothetical protein [Okeania sp. SIO2G5]